MTRTVEFQSRVGADGVLDLRVPLQEMGAGAEVVVTIGRAQDPQASRIKDLAQCGQLADESYGSCADLALERPPQGQFETREAVE